MMSSSRLKGLFLSVMLSLAGPVLAVDPSSDGPAQPQASPSFSEVERVRIERERTVEMQRQQQVESACYQRFAVNDCLLESRVKHREVMADLKRQEITLNDRERRLRSSEQLRRIEDKVSSPERDIDLMNRQQQGIQKNTDAANTAAQKAADAANQVRERAERQAEQQRKQQQATERPQNVPARPRKPRRRPAGFRTSSRMPPATASRWSATPRTAPARAASRCPCLLRRLGCLPCVPDARCGRAWPRAGWLQRRMVLGEPTRGSMRTTTSDRLSPPPRARLRALSIRNSVASRGERPANTEPNSAFVK